MKCKYLRILSQFKTFWSILVVLPFVKNIAHVSELIFSTAHSGAKSKSCGQKSKIDFFSFEIKLISYYSKLFVDLHMRNIFLMGEFKVILFV